MDYKDPEQPTGPIANRKTELFQRRLGILDIPKLVSCGGSLTDRRRFQHVRSFGMKGSGYATAGLLQQPRVNVALAVRKPLQSVYFEVTMKGEGAAAVCRNHVRSNFPREQFLGHAGPG